MLTIRQFVLANKIKMDVEWTDHNPNISDDKWTHDARHFKCTVHYKRRRMMVYFSQGLLIEKEPTTEDVLDCLANDASGFDSTRSFDEWAGDYGYDTDSRKAKQTYRTIERQRERLERLLGSAAYETLLTQTERL